MLILDVNKINERYLVEVIVTDKERLRLVIEEMNVSRFTCNGIGIDLESIYHSKDTLKWVDSEELVNKLYETIEAFNEKYGDKKEEEGYDRLNEEYMDLLICIQETEKEERTPIIEAQLFYMKGYLDCLTKRLQAYEE